MKADRIPWRPYDGHGELEVRVEPVLLADGVTVEPGTYAYHAAWLVGGTEIHVTECRVLGHRRRRARKADGSMFQVIAVRQAIAHGFQDTTMGWVYSTAAAAERGLRERTTEDGLWIEPPSSEPPDVLA
jgi:hypothetical protein